MHHKPLFFMVTLAAFMLLALLRPGFNGTWPWQLSNGVELPIGWRSDMVSPSSGQISNAVCNGVDVTGPNIKVRGGWPFSYSRGHIYDCGDEGDTNNLAKVADFVAFAGVLGIVGISTFKIGKRVLKHE